MKFTIKQIRNYLLKSESRGDIMYNLSDENIMLANIDDFEINGIFFKENFDKIVFETNFENFNVEVKKIFPFINSPKLSLIEDVENYRIIDNSITWSGIYNEDKYVEYSLTIENLIEIICNK